MEVSGQLHSLATLPPTPDREAPHPPVSIVWAPELAWTLWTQEESFVPGGNRTTSQLFTLYRGHYTD
jgi:hypothetical protein